MSDESEFARLLEEIAAAPAEAPPGLEAELPRALGRYRLVERLGEGGMGVVYRALDQVLRREVALKLPGVRYRGVARQRLLHEARRVAGFDHPNIARVYDAGEIEGEAFIAMEYVRGETLRAAIERGPLRELEGLGLLLPIARALAHTHERGIVHLDLKPENVMVDGSGGVKVLDFGLAQPASALEVKGDVDATLTRDAQAPASTGDAGSSPSRGWLGWELRAGTPGYMSPEQRGAGSVGCAADVYAFGVIAHELMTGHPPSKASAAGAPPDRAWSPAACALVLSCLATSDTERPRDGAALESALLSLSDGGRVRPRLRRALLPLLTAALLASAALWVLAPSTPSPAPSDTRLASAGENGSRAGLFIRTDEYTEHVSFLAPSGKKLTFVDERGLMLLDLETGERRRLLPPEAHVAQGHWLPGERELVLLIDSGRVPAKLERFELGLGKRTPLAASVMNEFALSPDGKRLASSVNEGSIELTALDASSPTQILPAAGATPGTLCWSPDGEWIAWHDWRRVPSALVALNTKSGELRTLVVQEGLRTKLGVAAFTWHGNWQLSWQQLERGVGSLWTAAVDPHSLKLSGARRISEQPVLAVWMQGNAAGDRLVVHQHRSHDSVLRARVLANGRLESPLVTPARRSVDEVIAGWQPGQLGLLTTLDGKRRPALTSLEDGSLTPWLQPGDETQPWWALGERGFLFYRSSPEGARQLWRQPETRGAAPERVADVPQNVGSDALYCASRAARCFRARYADGAWNIAELSLSSGSLREAFAIPGVHGDRLAVSPDAQRWVAGREEGQEDRALRFFDNQGALTGHVELPDHCFAQYVAFAPDGVGAYAAAMCQPAERYQVFLVSPAGSVERLWAGMGWVDSLSLSPDRQWLAFNHRTLDHEIWTLDVPGPRPPR